MKATSNFITLTFCVVLSFVISNPLKAQSNPGSTDTPSLKETILKNDSLFWKAYNSCDIDQLRTFFTDDLEFYHDKSGLTTSLESFMESIENGICSNEDWRLRREVVEGSIEIFPIDNYGAVITGEHLFYVKEKEKNERPEGKAQFFHLWQFKDNHWKMSRVFSYDHGPIPFKQEKTEVALSEEVLMQFTGSYKSPQAGLVTITMETGHLFLKSGGFQATLYPESEDSFFIQEGNMQFTFTRDDDGNVMKMSIIQNGTTVDEAEKIE